MKHNNVFHFCEGAMKKILYFFIDGFEPVRTQSRQSRAWNPQLVAVWN